MDGGWTLLHVSFLHASKAEKLQVLQLLNLECLQGQLNLAGRNKAGG